MTAINHVFLSGRPAICPDCGHETIFKAGCVLGDLKESAPTISPRLADRLVNDLLDHDRCFACAAVLNENRGSQALWINLIGDETAGPFCHSCFVSEVQAGLGGSSEMNEDVKVYSAALNNKMTRQALEALKASPRRKAFEREMATPLSVKTIDPRKLF